MERSFIIENTSTRNRLIFLDRQLSDADLNINAGKGWTISIIFAHLAFWDQRTIILLRRWGKSGISVSPVDLDVLNDTLLPFFKAIPPRMAVDLAIISAETVDREIENLSDEMISAIDAMGDKIRLGRYIHRQMHIKKIEEILNISGRII